MREHEVGIIGAGFAGLALAARLRGRGVQDFRVLEKGTEVGAFWAGHYPRIRLHSPYHDLPDDGGLRRPYGVFLRRDELLGYFRGYAQRHQLVPRLRFGAAAENVSKDRDAWRVDTGKGEYRFRFLAIATGANHRPHLPVFGGEEDFLGIRIHSRGYQTGERFAGKRVLVVGSGNSACEIATDLCEHGARSVSLWVRGPRHFLPLRTMGWMARVAHTLRIEFTDRSLDVGHRYTRSHPDFAAFVRKKDAVFTRLSVDLSKYGIRKPDDGLFTEMYLKSRVGTADQGSIPLIRSGAIEVIDGNRFPIEAFWQRGVRMGGDAREFDAVVLATGFTPGLDVVLKDSDGLTDWRADVRQQMPKTDGRCRSSVAPNLFFPGFDLSANGGLSLGRWGIEIADHIADASLR